MASRTRHAILLGLIASIGIALMMNGAVAAPYRQIAILVLILPLFATLGTRIRQPATIRLLMWWMVVAGGLLGWALAQSVPVFAGMPGNAVWEQLTEAAIPAQHTISVSPATTLTAIPALVLPLCVFAAILLLCQDKRAALVAWKALAVLGLILTALSALLELAFPELTFFSRFEVGRGDFNGIFVNRNTTAAFLGLVAFATAGWLMLPQRETRSAPGNTGVGWKKVFLASLLFLVLIALITTRSRAGVTLGLTCVTLAVAAVSRVRKDRSHHPARRLSGRIKILLILGASLAIFTAFGEPVVSRMGVTSGYGRVCAWRAAVQMIAERPLTGWGLGTFADTFPQFRDVVCLGTSGTWTRAHNSHLEFLAGVGLIGGAIAGVALALLIRVLVNGMQTRRSFQPIPILCLGALAFVMMHSALDFPLQVPGVALYFAAQMGAGCAISILPRSGRSSRRAQ